MSGLRHVDPGTPLVHHVAPYVSAAPRTGLVAAASLVPDRVLNVAVAVAVAVTTGVAALTP
ncbi:hypothetical protein ACFV0T_38840 [Streptomyces sp. NPDC059582]|uniref:hypothetical protein n=1 Tax=Streptomyces sp. NPDC059582 TaxID=3346875 RepID=UPI0036C3DA7D